MGEFYLEKISDVIGSDVVKILKSFEDIKKYISDKFGPINDLGLVDIKIDLSKRDWLPGALDALNYNLTLIKEYISDYLDSRDNLLNEYLTLLGDLTNYTIDLSRSYNLGLKPAPHLKSSEIKEKIKSINILGNVDYTQHGEYYIVSKQVNSNGVFTISFYAPIEFTRINILSTGMDLKSIRINGVSVDNYFEWYKYICFLDNIQPSDVSIDFYIRGDEARFYSPILIRDTYFEDGYLEVDMLTDLVFYGGEIMKFFRYRNTLIPDISGSQFKGYPYPVFYIEGEDDEIYSIFPVYTDGPIGTYGDYTIVERPFGGYFVKGKGALPYLEYDIHIPDTAKWYFLYRDGSWIRIDNVEPHDKISYAVLSDSVGIITSLYSYSIFDSYSGMTGGVYVG